LLAQKLQATNAVSKRKAAIGATVVGGGNSNTKASVGAGAPAVGGNVIKKAAAGTVAADSYDNATPAAAAKTETAATHFNDQSYIIVTYFCQTNKQRMRPFSNKRYDPKYHPIFTHPVRKLSYNHLQML